MLKYDERLHCKADCILCVHVQAWQKTMGMPTLPATKMFLVASNHQSHLDASALYVSLWARGIKKVYALGARDYFFSNPLWAWFVTKIMNVVPCNRRGFSLTEVRAWLESWTRWEIPRDEKKKEEIKSLDL